MQPVLFSTTWDANTHHLWFPEKQPAMHCTRTINFDIEMFPSLTDYYTYMAEALITVIEFTKFPEAHLQTSVGKVVDVT